MMHRPSSRLLPELAASLSAQYDAIPSICMASSGMLSWSHVSMKANTQQSFHSLWVSLSKCNSSSLSRERTLESRSAGTAGLELTASIVSDSIPCWHSMSKSRPSVAITATFIALTFSKVSQLGYKTRDSRTTIRTKRRHLNMRTLVFLLAVLWVCDGVKFGQLCSGNPNNSRRTSDGWGEGHYGARRGNRVHQGLDIVCRDGSTVYAPFDVTLDRKVIVYNDPENKKTAINEGIQMRGEGLCFKLFYVRPDRTSGSVSKGERIGTMLPMQTVYPGITSHVHVQMCDRSDPTGYF
uniref:Leukocyte cell-derived chemotaxin 2 like n=1 Tax=Amphiprion ocellaris TaxID=80972 RepID=A0A3Q1D9D1_AMPOC